MTDRLEEIREFYTADDVEWLVAEVERLRGDVDALLIKHGKLSEFCAKQSAALDEYVAEAERLRWFEENMDPWLTRHGPTRALFCSICKSYSHKPDCEYVLHGGKKRWGFQAKDMTSGTPQRASASAMLEREVERLKWFEERLVPAERFECCGSCEFGVHAEDCEYVAHGGKR